MKKILLAFILAISTLGFSQDYMGLWSFSDIDTSETTEEISEEDKNMLKNMFLTMTIEIKEKDVFELAIMGQKESGDYSVTDGVVAMVDNGEFRVTGTDVGLFTMGNMRLILKRGAAEIVEKTYVHLTETSYPAVDFDTKDILKNWQTTEVRAAEGEDAAMTESLMSQLEVEFLSEDEIKFTIMGIEQEQGWKRGEEKGELFFIAQNGDKAYTVNKLTDTELIMTLKKDGTMIYFTVKEE